MPCNRHPSWDFIDSDVQTGSSPSWSRVTQAGLGRGPRLPVISEPPAAPAAEPALPKLHLPVRGRPRLGPVTVTTYGSLDRLTAGGLHRHDQSCSLRSCPSRRPVVACRLRPSETRSSGELLKESTPPSVDREQGRVVFPVQRPHDGVPVLVGRVEGRHRESVPFSG